MLLEASHLSFKRDQKEILRNVHFKIEGSKITAVLGANGSGKSTLLSLLAGLLDTDSGFIQFNTKKIIGPAHKLIPGHEGIALVRQDARLTPYATVRENLRHVLRMYDEDYQEEKINELSALLGLENYLERIVKFLSGGEQQRVAIAAALAAGPELLLMDEPFSQTDMFLKQELKEYLFQVVEKLNVSILFVTHSPEDALAMSDTILILHEGEIVESGNSTQLYFSPKNKTSAQLTGYCNFIPTENRNLNLHKIENEYLIRPDQIVISESENKKGYPAIVTKTEFCGFFKGVYLFAEDWKTDLFVTHFNQQFIPRVGQKVWMLLDNS